MEISKVAPMALRLCRTGVRAHTPQSRAWPTFKARLVQVGDHPFTHTSIRNANPPLPPSADDVHSSQAHSPLVLEPVPPQTQQPPPEPGTQPAPKRKFSLRTYITATSFLLIGVLGGQLVRAIILPPPLPIPDSEEDSSFLEKLHSDLSSLPVTKELRSRPRSEWREYDPTSVNPIALQGDDADRSMTSGALRGSRGLGVSRSFWNESEKREITVLFFGGACAGWPGVAHGGAIATVMAEACERMVKGGPNAPAMFGIPGPSGGRGSGKMECESLSLSYKKPTAANNFFVLRSEIEGDPGPEEGTKQEEETKEKDLGSMLVKMTLEDAQTGKVCVEASGRCKPASTYGQARAVTKEINEEAGGWFDVFTRSIVG